jgi:peptidoglycan/LPS O-acetylase OafA/YrhL
MKCQLDKDQLILQTTDLRHHRGRIPCLDGWRAISISLVVFCHSHLVHWAGDLGRAGGIAGVRFFFVISGFLITWLLLREEATTGRISLRNFYVRRILRIFPVYYTFLMVCWLLEAFGVANNMTNTSQWWLNVFFLANYGSCEGPTGVLWSLGVEEQFYLLWPLFFVGVCLFRRKVISFAILLATMVIAPVLRGLTIVMGMDGTDILSHRFTFLHHMDMLAIGCLGALLIWHYPRVLAYAGAKWKLFVPIGLISLFLPYAARDIQGLGIETVFGPTLQAIGFLCLMLTSVSNPNLALFKPLQWAPVVWLGTISYSLYLWHAVFLTGQYFGDGDNFLVIFGLPISVLVAGLSYHFLELPIVGLRRRFRASNDTDTV